MEKVRVHSSEGFQHRGKICCVLGAFYKGLFYACFSDERHEKEFEEGDVSNHLEKILSNTIKAESTIGEWNYNVFALCLSPLYLFPHLPVTWFFLASLFNIRVMNALTIWTSHIVACVFILFCFLLIVIVKQAFALSGREVNSPIPRPFHSSVKFRKSEAT